MDWHWNTGIPWSLLFSSVKIHHSITSIQSKSLSRRCWSSPLWPSYWWMQEKAIRQYRILVRRDEEALRQCSALVDRKCVSVLARGGRQRKRFQYCLNPNYPHQFLYLRAIQGHTGSTIYPALQDNVLSPEGFTECIYHVGNGKELKSIVNHGLIPGAVSLKTGRQSVFCTVVNPMDNRDGSGKPCAHKQESRHAEYLEKLSEYSILVQIEARSTKRTAILSNKIKRSFLLWHTACRVHWESDMHEDQGSTVPQGKRDSKTACCC